MNKKYLSFIGYVELTDERLKHILQTHPELKFHLKKFSHLLVNPEIVRRSKYDAHVLLLYKYFASIKNGKYLMIAVKKDIRNFILTAYLTDKIKAGKPYETET